MLKVRKMSFFEKRRKGKLFFLVYQIVLLKFPYKKQLNISKQGPKKQTSMCLRFIITSWTNVWEFIGKEKAVCLLYHQRNVI